MNQYHDLTPEEQRVILEKGTERPFTGTYTDADEKGVYLCKRCGAPLFLSEHKFSSHCGWPSFDDEIEDAVRRQPDADGRRTEIVCNRCDGHLGHVFEGEQLTEKDLRHCVNSISMTLFPLEKEGLRRAIFAGGCFWGVEHQLSKVDGVKEVVSGYTGGHVVKPSYEQVCSGKTGHSEAVLVTFDPERTDYETVARRFFEIHNPAHGARDSGARGTQYGSAVFYLTLDQKRTAERLIGQLRDNSYEVNTAVLPAHEFYPAEEYHQDYYRKKGADPACHAYEARFDK